jgi:hypothetical protein
VDEVDDLDSGNGETKGRRAGAKMGTADEEKN